MKVSPTIKLQEMIDILRQGLAGKFGEGVEIADIVVESHNKAVIDIEADTGLVTAVAFRHKAK